MREARRDPDTLRVAQDGHDRRTRCVESGSHDSAHSPNERDPPAVAGGRSSSKIGRDSRTARSSAVSFSTHFCVHFGFGGEIYSTSGSGAQNAGCVSCLLGGSSRSQRDLSRGHCQYRNTSLGSSAASSSVQPDASRYRSARVVHRQGVGRHRSCSVLGVHGPLPFGGLS